MTNHMTTWKWYDDIKAIIRTEGEGVTWINLSSGHKPQIQALRKIHFTVTTPLKTMFSEWSLPFRFSNCNSAFNAHLSYAY
jgi:hypothetical protein